MVKSVLVVGIGQVLAAIWAPVWLASHVIVGCTGAACLVREGRRAGLGLEKLRRFAGQAALSWRRHHSIEISFSRVRWTLVSV